jgi:Protein of unknown function (DUF2934)
MSTQLWKAILYASGDFPDTQIEIVSVSKSKTAVIKMPDGELKTVDLIALIDWSSDWYDPITGCSGHADTFSSPKPSHPITGLPWSSHLPFRLGSSPDDIKAMDIIKHMVSKLDISHEQISERAKRIWEERGMPQGCDEEI